MRADGYTRAFFLFCAPPCSRLNHENTRQFLSGGQHSSPAYRVRALALVCIRDQCLCRLVSIGRRVCERIQAKRHIAPVRVRACLLLFSLFFFLFFLSPHTALNGHGLRRSATPERAKLPFCVHVPCMCFVCLMPTGAFHDCSVLRIRTDPSSFACPPVAGALFVSRQRGHGQEQGRPQPGPIVEAFRGRGQGALPGTALPQPPRLPLRGAGWTCWPPCAACAGRRTQTWTTVRERRCG